MEINNIVEEFGRIINTTKFNEVYIFRGDEPFQALAGSEIDPAASSAARLIRYPLESFSTDFEPIFCTIFSCLFAFNAEMLCCIIIICTLLNFLV